VDLVFIRRIKGTAQRDVLSSKSLNATGKDLSLIKRSNLRTGFSQSRVVFISYSCQIIHRLVGLGRRPSGSNPASGISAALRPAKIVRVGLILSLERCPIFFIEDIGVKLGELSTVFFFQLIIRVKIWHSLRGCMPETNRRGVLWLQN
jgi:hypothetical protein